MPAVISIEGLTKTYKSGHQALKRVDLEIEKGEIFALLGPNGAGKTTMISIVCGIVTPSSGTIIADGHDIQSDYRAARTRIGLVPQENLVGKATIVMWSTDGSAEWIKPWTWFTSARWNRIGGTF